MGVTLILGLLLPPEPPHALNNKAQTQADHKADDVIVIIPCSIEKRAHDIFMVKLMSMWFTQIDKTLLFCNKIFQKASSTYGRVCPHSEFTISVIKFPIVICKYSRRITALVICIGAKQQDLLGAIDNLPIISTKSKHKLMKRSLRSYVLICRTALRLRENALNVLKHFPLNA